jgi:hypothetical protein
MSSIRVSVNPSNLIAPIKVNSKMLKDYDFEYNEKKYKTTDLDILYNSAINDDITLKYKKRVDRKMEEHFIEEDKQFIRSSIPKRFYKFYQ